MTWFRSRYVQHLERENAELRETVKRMMQPQFRYLLYGEAAETGTKVEHEPVKSESVKIPPRVNWKQLSKTLEYMVSPEAVLDQKRRERESAKQEAMNG